MRLQPGTTLGPYAVTAKIGEGGMGEVWQARDTKLDRDVALKVLPEAFTSDPDRLARFEREAKVLASLNHPNIGSIYGLEEAEGIRALVLELVEGPTLADRIKQGPIPIDEALPIAKQIAEALEAAHEQGVIHRDLKPANIKVKDDGTVKVLDFGLAKAFQPDASAPSMSQSPTISLTAAATQMGMVIGTAAYMAPEQASGKTVDKRADVWAFGVVLYEMLSGARPFQGEDVSKTLAHVIAIDPDWSALPKSVPPVLGTFLRGCLEKKPKQRVHDVADVRLAMEGAFETAANTSSEPVVIPTLRFWQRPLAVLGLAVIVALLTGLAVWSLSRPDPGVVSRFQIPLSENEAFSTGARRWVALSPDGRYLAMAVNGALSIRRLDQLAATSLAGTEDAGTAFFSPESQWIGFRSGGSIRKVSVSGGAPVSLTETDGVLWGASWGDDDTILFGQGAEGIWRVSGAGGTAEQVITVGAGEEAHDPQMLPGNEAVLFTLRPGGQSWDEAQIVVQDLATGQRSVLIEGREARYVSTGHLLYGFNGVLLAVPFDPGTRQLTGGPVSVVEGVGASPRLGGAVQYALTTDGSLAYIPGAVGEFSSSRSLVWVQRDGQEEPLPLPPRPYDWVRVSPDGNRVAIAIADEGTDIWISELARGTLIRLTEHPGFDTTPVWTPDGQAVVFASNRDGPWGLYSRAADGTGPVEQLITIEDAAIPPAPYAWSPDGQSLVFEYRLEDSSSVDIGVISMSDPPTWEPLLAGDAEEGAPAISPDGRWIAYHSDQTGQREIYLQRFPELGERQQVSTRRGMDPVWTSDGRALFYRGGPLGPPAEMSVVGIETEPSVTIGASELLFEKQYYRTPASTRRFDRSSNDQRLLMIDFDDLRVQSFGSAANQIIFVQNFFEELKERVPVR